MGKYRKKPIVIEAVQLKTDNWNEVHNFIQARNGNMSKYNLVPEKKLIIKTLEGEMTADIGDWIIKGIKGEFYPCKPDIFEATYEKVEEKIMQWFGE